MIVGRLFTEDIREAPHDILYSMTTVANSEPRTSTVQLEHQSPREWMESFYTNSEQRPCRCFDLGDESYALLAAQPDADREWLAGLDPERSPGDQGRRRSAGCSSHASSASIVAALSKKFYLC